MKKARAGAVKLYHEIVLTWESLLVLLASLGLLALTVWKKEEFMTEASWKRLIERSNILRLIFALSFASLTLYILAQFTRLMRLSSPAVDIDGIPEIIITIHMLVLAATVFAVIPIFSAMRRVDKNAL